MSDQDVAMRIAVASAFRDCGLPSDEQDVDDFLVALRSFGYVVERLERRSGDEQITANFSGSGLPRSRSGLASRGAASARGARTWRTPPSRPRASPPNRDRPRKASFIEWGRDRTGRGTPLAYPFPRMNRSVRRLRQLRVRLRGTTLECRPHDPQILQESPRPP
jgi:hypothetical protein